jgi:hypothetical protein
VTTVDNAIMSEAGERYARVRVVLDIEPYSFL